jgi:hypothetical protein
VSEKVGVSSLIKLRDHWLFRFLGVLPTRHYVCEHAPTVDNLLVSLAQCVLRVFLTWSELLHYHESTVGIGFLLRVYLYFPYYKRYTARRGSDHDSLLAHYNNTLIRRNFLLLLVFACDLNHQTTTLVHSHRCRHRAKQPK